MKCRHCKTLINLNFIDLGFSPPSNQYINHVDYNKPEKYYPLKVSTCNKCFLVQTEDYVDADELFHSDYAYFSSTSKFFLKHAEKYVDYIENFLKLNKSSFVCEIASNDGYLLKNFIKKDVPCLGIEPTKLTAEAAKKNKIPVINHFFSYELSKEIIQNYKKADLVIANNVLAHVPDINDFVKGIANLIKKSGVLTVEFPHLLNLIKLKQFDTIYHEHFSYLSLISVKTIFNKFKLNVFKVEEINTHGGSLRVYASKDTSFKVCSSVPRLIKKELSYGLNKRDIYNKFADKIKKIKLTFLKFITEEKLKNKKICAYGAAAKGNTLLNYIGIKKDIIDAVFDNAKSKQGKFMPGSKIPIVSPSKFMKYNPDILIIFPWNIREEIETLVKSKKSKVKLIDIREFS